MKFDFVIGNPPYQEETAQKETENGQKSLKNVFQHFQTSADSFSKKGSVLVYPAIRWIHQAGKGLKDFGYKQINEPSLAKLILYEDAHVLFPSALINDGISIVVKNFQKKTNGFEYTFISKTDETITVDVESPGDSLLTISPHDALIAKKIDNFVRVNHLQFLYDAILPRSLFGIESDFVEKNPTLVRPFTTNDDIDFKNEIKLFTNDKARSTGRTKWFVCPRKVITKNVDKIDEWQVTVISANAGGQRRDNQLMIIDNHSAFGRSRVALRSFSSLNEAENFVKYVSSSFIRYAFLLTNEALSSVGKRVPDLMNYKTNNGIIDFLKDIDSQLYNLIGLKEDQCKSLWGDAVKEQS